MKRKKTLLSLLSAAAMTALLLTGCGSGNAAAPESTAGAGSTASEDPTEGNTAAENTAEDASESTDASETQAGADEAAGSTAGTDILEDGTFTLGFDAEFEPYGYMDENGEYTGFDLDLAAEVCARNGWELVKRPIDWDAKDMELSSGSIDCIWNGFTINGREDEYTWSVPYVDSSQVFVVNADAGIATFADLSGKAVGVQRDSSALAALEANAELTGTFKELVQHADYNTALMDLEAGAIEAVAIDIGVAERQIEARGDSFTMLDEKIATEQYGIGFLKGNTALKDQVEKTLLEMVADGTFTKIAQQYGLEDSVCLGK